jgi:CheY-like chemotaxis protein/two-component sensor histidine kinase
MSDTAHTDRQTVEHQLRQTIAHLTDVDRRKNEFLAILAHELRSPLAPILHALEIFRRTGTGPREVTAVIERQVGHMVRLIDDLLDVSRISQGQIELRPEQVDLALVVEQTAEASRPLLDRASVSLTVTLPPAPVCVTADAARLTQIVGNLLNNASKFTPPGGHVWLVVEHDSQGASIRVRDTGIGIAEPDLASVFELFTQLDAGLDRSRGGLGLGLALARRLVELQGGTIEASSPGVGQGAEFIVRLPACAHQSLALDHAAPDDVPAAASRRILVVDDNEDAADCLALLLKMQGHDVRTAHDGLDAVEAAIAFEPDAVLLDIGLPKLNGYEAGARIRALPFGDRVLLVALTGWGRDSDRDRATDAGFDAHLVKPADQLALSALIAQLPRLHS